MCDHGLLLKQDFGFLPSAIFNNGDKSIIPIPLNEIVQAAPRRSSRRTP
jgi:hypothetical protein